MVYQKLWKFLSGSFNKWSATLATEEEDTSSDEDSNCTEGDRLMAPSNKSYVIKNNDVAGYYNNNHNSGVSPIISPEKSLDSNVCVVKVEKPMVNQETFDTMYGFIPPEDKGFWRETASSVKSACSCRPISFLLHLLPILKWLPKYKPKKYLFGDSIAGFTVAVMHIPQGMAYALLANVPPIVGIYMAFFPIFVYIIMGTSKHVSMGTFAVVCLMTGKVVLEYSSDDISPIQVATVVSIGVGFWQILMGILHLGNLSVILSSVLVSGFTTAAAFHVFTSQIKNIFGIPVQNYSGMFKLIYTYIDIFENLYQTNIAAVIISAVTMTILVIVNELIKPIWNKKIKFPIPIELLTVIGGTLFSTYLNFQANYGIKVVGNIPTGLPDPTPPPMQLLPNIIVDCLVISIVAYCISISMAKIFARKVGYDVDANQELLAQGTSNIFGSFFSCGPIAASLSRSLIQHTVGGKTQLASFISCMILLFVLLWIGPFFETLPNCVLSSIIIVALKGMFMQVKDLSSAWKTSRVDALVWAITFLSTVLLDIDIGLVIGIMASLLSIIYLNQVPYVATLGGVGNTDIYLDTERYGMVQESDCIKVFHYSGGLHFANVENLKTALQECTGLNVRKLLVKLAKQKDKQKREEKKETSANNEQGEKKKFTLPVFKLRSKKTENDDVVKIQNNEPDVPEIDKEHTTDLPTTIEINGNGNISFLSSNNNDLKFLLLDFSRLSFIDPSGVKALESIIEDYKTLGLQVIISGCSVPVLHSLQRCKFYEKVPESNVFPSVHAAILHCHLQIDSDNNTTL